MIFVPNSLERQSHKKVEAECDFKASKKCKNVWITEYRNLMKTFEENNEKIMCLNCMRVLKYKGRNNPSCKYRKLDDSFFSKIDSEEKAYLLGWIASDGHIRKRATIIEIHEKDKETLLTLKDIICPEMDIKSVKRKTGTHAYLIISSKQISEDLCGLLKIKPGKKSDVVQFPDLDNDKLKWQFLRGYFDGDGCICSNLAKKTSPRCSISSNSKDMLLSIKNFTKIPCSISRNAIEWQGNNALDFLGKLYDDCKIVNNRRLALNRKRELFLDWSTWVPTRGFGRMLESFRCHRLRKDAVFPSKVRVSDSGYDVTIIEKVESFGNVQVYTTGLRLQPIFGYYLMLVPRSSIIKKGYTFANNIGILDRGFLGEVKVALLKTDQNAPDLELPCKIAQIIPQQIQHFEIVEVDSFDETGRGEGGFGSTDKVKND